MRISGEAMERALSWGFDIAVSGGPGFASAEEVAASYADGSGSVRERAQSLIRWQIGKAAVTGFVTGVPGFPFLPVTIPANLGAVLALQLRMVAAIAILAGKDPKQDQVRTLCVLCLAGNAVGQIAKKAGIEFGKKLSEQAIKQLSGKALIHINKLVGFRLATKFGRTGIVNLGKMVPFVGGMVGGTFDAGTTALVGRAALSIFVDDSGDGEDPVPAATQR